MVKGRPHDGSMDIWRDWDGRAVGGAHSGTVDPVAFWALRRAGRSPNGEPDKGEHCEAQSDSRDPRHFEVGNPALTKRHATLLSARHRKVFA
jgi:hypothetical protein